MWIGYFIEDLLPCIRSWELCILSWGILLEDYWTQLTVITSLFDISSCKLICLNFIFHRKYNFCLTFQFLNNHIDWPPKNTVFLLLLRFERSVIYFDDLFHLKKIVKMVTCVVKVGGSAIKCLVWLKFWRILLYCIYYFKIKSTLLLS